MNLDRAIACYEAGDKDAARLAALAIPAKNSDYAGARNLLAVIAQDQGQQVEAEAYAREAIAAAPGHPLYLNTLGNGLLAQGRSEEAVAAMAEAHAALPDQPDILFNLANAQRQAGYLETAAGSFRRAIALRPNHIGAYNNLAVVLKALGDVEAAAAVLIEAVAYAPGSAELRFNLGNALQAAGRRDAAEAAYRKAVELAPGHAEAHANLGVVLAEAGRKDAARDAFRKAIALNPDLVPAYVGLADLVDDGTMDAVAHRRAVLALNPKLAPVRSSLLMCMHYTNVSREELLAEHRAFGLAHNKTGAPAFAATHTAGRRLKLGIVSGDFRFHAMLFFALPVLQARPHDDFEIFCYSNTVRPDEHTQDFRAAADHWRDVRGLSNDALTNLIVRDRIDILIDLSGHAPHNRLLVFAARAAPLQVAWGDYVNTRGLAAIDVLLGDTYHTPPEDDALYIENVVRFAPDYVCYRPPAYAPGVTAAPVLRNGYVTFGTFSEVTKIGPEAVSHWAAVLKAIPTSRFLLNGYLFKDETRRAHIAALFANEGIGAERLIFRTGGPHPEFLAQYADVDVILDTAPYSGGLTTCEALLMGVPVLTIAGDRFCGRHAAAHLVNGGSPQWVASSLEEFVGKAQVLAGDPPGLSAHRPETRARFLVSPLCDVPKFAENFYGALRATWDSRFPPS
ncbi:MAG: tetratricopeptide repeat protein [Rhodospirillaceae bacterium]|nr:tetratricopeptide repeat protein [Rhodospirillaceae bacterium]